MALFKQFTAKNGVPVNYHRILEAKLLGTENIVRLQVGSWISEESFVAGNPAVWSTYTAVPAEDLYTQLQAKLLLDPEFENSTVLQEAEPLEVLKQRKWLEIKQKQQEQEQAGFEFENHVYNSDLVSQTRIQGAVLQAVQDSAYKTTWTLKDNSSVELNSQQLQALGNALIQHVESIHNKAQSLRQLIQQAQTPQELDKIVW